MKGSILAAVVLVLGAAAGGSADDKWEFLSGGSDDGPGFSNGLVNALAHGAIQTHDLQGTLAAPDQDWMSVPTLNRHSYEARVSGNSVIFSYGGCPSCAQIDRVDGSGAVLTGAGGNNNDRVVRWVSTATQSGINEYIRVVGPSTGFSPPNSSTANHQYTLQFFDTTYFLPRFNNSGGQVTVLLIQNTGGGTVSGSIYFYNPAGTLLHTAALNVPVGGLQVVNTAAIAQLAGLSGAASIAHDGGWGALAAKSVALEAATGFSFDTPATTIPR